MKKPWLIWILVGLVSLLSACGGSTQAADPSPTATQPPAQAGSSSGPTAPAGSEPSSGKDAIQVDISLADNTIQSSLTTFQAGVAYSLVIKNTGRHAHNFNINQPVADAGSLDAALQGALLAVPQTELAPGATVTRDFTFPDSAAGANLEFSCLIRRHYEDGMLLPISVTP